MEMVKGKPFFCESKKKIKIYPYLNQDAQTDILIVGGGIDGAIANYYLSEKYDVMLVDKGRFGFLCTSCATALLEYQLDEFAEDLKGELSEEDIVSAYKMGLSSIDKLNKLTKKLGNTYHFATRPTFLYSNSKLDIRKFKNEFEFRKKHNFDVEFYTKENNPFTFEIEAGIYAKNGGAELSPYLFTKSLIENARNQCKIFENSEIVHIEKVGEEYHAKTAYGNIIKTKKIILATGFDWSLFSKSKLFPRYTTYTIVTEPIAELQIYNQSLVHDNESSYHYMRKLPDDRIIYGGEDIVLNENINENSAENKYEKLLKSLQKMFPQFEDKLKISYKFCGAFGQTNNNLGLIGNSEDPNLFYFLSCGANGIINAMYGVDLLDDLLNNRVNPLEKVFSPLRKI